MTKTTSRVPAVVDALVSAGLVDAARADDAERVITGSLGTPEHKVSSRGLLVEIAAYVGGALVVASVGLFLAQYWSDFSGTLQVTVLALAAVLLLAAGLAVSRLGTGYAAVRSGSDPTRRRLVSALLTAGAFASACAVGRVMDLNAGNEPSDLPVFVGALTMLALSAAGYAYASSAIGQLAMLGACFTAVTSGWSLVDSHQNSTLWPGLIFLSIGVLWLLAAEGRLFREVVVARAIGAGLTLFGAQFVRFDDVHNNLAYLLMAVVAVAAFAMYLRTVAWPYLVVGVLGVTLVVPEAIIDWTEGSLGPAGGVLIAGLALLGASLAGLRVRQEVSEESDSATG